jgi:endonuclease YncB( thermonuclease family)
MRAYWTALLIFLLPSLAAAAEMIGTGEYVVDGDTFVLAMPGYQVNIRICGIDAPESGQPRSREAWAKLSKIVQGHAVTCGDMRASQFAASGHRLRRQVEAYQPGPYRSAMLRGRS